MKVTIRFYAYLREESGASTFDMEIPENTTVEQLKELLTEHFSQIDLTQNVLVAVNQVFANDSTNIPAEADVAFFPPVSGGDEPKTIVEITTDKFDVDDVTRRIQGVTTGAICVFIGVVRGMNDGQDEHLTTSLEYEAYQPMAEKKMLQVCAEIRECWHSVGGIAIIQRVGTLSTGEQTVLIACESAHRDTGVFEATRFGIDRLKEIVPVWKKEHRVDGTNWVTGSFIPGKTD